MNVHVLWFLIFRDLCQGFEFFFWLFMYRSFLNLNNTVHVNSSFQVEKKRKKIANFFFLDDQFWS